MATAGVSVSCPHCGTVLLASGAAPKGRCRACGTVFEIPRQQYPSPIQPPAMMATPAAPAPAKACCLCGVDVTHARRTKDDAGNYYCGPCRDGQLAALAAQGGYAPQRPKSPGQPCTS